jgi:hypothetical protein
MKDTHACNIVVVVLVVVVVVVVIVFMKVGPERVASFPSFAIEDLGRDFPG